MQFIVTCACVLFLIATFRISKSFCANKRLELKGEYAKIRKLVAQESLLENSPYSNPSTRLFNWDLSTTELTNYYEATTVINNDDKTNEIKTSRRKVKNKKKKSNKRKRMKENIELATGNDAKRINRKGRCNKRKNRKRCRRRRQRKQFADILEVTTARNRNVFQLNAENNETIKELIMKLNENPEYDYSKLLSQNNKSINTSKIDLKDSTTENYDILKITVDTPAPEVTEVMSSVDKTTTESNEVFVSESTKNNVLFATTTSTLPKIDDISINQSTNEINSLKNEVSVLFLDKRKKYNRYYGEHLKKARCFYRNGGCNQMCHNFGPTKCSCLDGFVLGTDLRNCLDINECSNGNGGCERQCYNTLGSFYCGCPQGFRLADDFKSCEDINECLLRNGHGPCQDTCHNTFGSYKCDCSGINGTRLADDAHSCKDIDECSEKGGGCSHNCINALGRAFCTCPTGLELGLDWKTCHDVDECKDEEVKMQCSFGCINTLGSYQCINPIDFQSDQSEVVRPTPDHIVCPPLFPPSHGFLECSREKAHAVRLRTRSGRTRITNRPGTFCNLVCPFGYRTLGKYHLTCGVDGKWFGTNHGKCLPLSKPTITCPKNRLYFLENGADQTKITFPKPNANVDWKHIVSRPAWGKNLSVKLNKGHYTVVFTATDTENMFQSSCSFNITVML